jgi:hypothetical protein
MDATVIEFSIVPENILGDTVQTPDVLLDLSLSRIENMSCDELSPGSTYDPVVQIGRDDGTPLSAGTTITHTDQTDFRIIAANRGHTDYDDSLSIEENDGVGISEVEYELRGPQDIPLASGTDDTSQYCIFGSDDATCDTWPLDNFEDMPSGMYTITARAALPEWAGWTEPVSTTFELPPVPVEIRDGDGLPLPSFTEVTTITDIVQRIIAYDPQHPDYNSSLSAQENDGTGIAEVEVRIYSPTFFEWHTATDDTAPYCVFGENEGVCTPMSQTQYEQMQTMPGTYIMQVRARPEGSQRWGDWSRVNLVDELHELYLPALQR